MFDDVMDPNDRGLLELTRCLEAYADARLSPTAVATINMRAVDEESPDATPGMSRAPHRDP